MKLLKKTAVVIICLIIGGVMAFFILIGVLKTIHISGLVDDHLEHGHVSVDCNQLKIKEY